MMLLWSVLLLAALVGGETDENAKVASKLYRAGVHYYLGDRWQECTDTLEEAIAVHKTENAAIAHCRQECARESFVPISKRNIDDMHFYEKAVKRTLCFLQCKRIKFPDVVFDMTSDQVAIDEINRLEPYNYLQLCLLRLERFQDAASAGFTYLVRHPDHPIVKSNMENYLKMKQVNRDEIVNREAEEYVPFYIAGMNSYDEKDWTNTATQIEEALQAYLTAEDKCRVLCEGSFDHGWLPDMTSSIANHFTFSLRCKQGCGQELMHLNGLYGEKLLADFYNYLQIAYYQKKSTQEACKAVASFLLIEPLDEDMLHNRKLYNCDEDASYEPRTEVIYYTTRNRYEIKMLKFINEEFTAEIEYEKAFMEGKLTQLENDLESNDV